MQILISSKELQESINTILVKNQIITQIIIDVRSIDSKGNGTLEFFNGKTRLDAMSNVKCNGALDWKTKDIFTAKLLNEFLSSIPEQPITLSFFDDRIQIKNTFEIKNKKQTPQ